jgi:molecular chaperone DnaK
MLKEAGDKLAGSDRETLDKALAEAKEALKSDDLDRIKQADEALKQAAYKLSEAMYAQSGGQPGAAAGASEPAADAGKKDDGGKVVDAEFD